MKYFYNNFELGLVGFLVIMKMGLFIKKYHIVIECVYVIENRSRKWLDTTINNKKHNRQN